MINDKILLSSETQIKIRYNLQILKGTFMTNLQEHNGFQAKIGTHVKIVKNDIENSIILVVQLLWQQPWAGSYRKPSSTELYI